MRIVEKHFNDSGDIEDLVDFFDGENNYSKLYIFEQGLKFECTKKALDSIQNNQYVQKNFKLNIKQINKNTYSVYVDKKEE